MRNGGTVLLAVLDLYVRIEIGAVTFDTDRSVTVSTESIAASGSFLILWSSQSRQDAIDGRCDKRNDHIIDQSAVSR